MEGVPFRNLAEGIGANAGELGRLPGHWVRVRRRAETKPAGRSKGGNDRTKETRQASRVVRGRPGLSLAVCCSFLFSLSILSLRYWTARTAGEREKRGHTEKRCCGGTANGWVRLPITGRIGLRVSVRERFRGGLVSGAWTKRNDPLVGDSGISRAVACVGEKEALVGRAQKRRVACRGRTRESENSTRLFPPNCHILPFVAPMFITHAPAEQGDRLLLTSRRDQHRQVGSVCSEPTISRIRHRRQSAFRRHPAGWDRRSAAFGDGSMQVCPEQCRYSRTPPDLLNNPT